MASYSYFVTRSAQRDLKKMNAVSRQRIRRKLEHFASADDPRTFAIQITRVRPPIYRFRVGKYRVFFDIRNHTLWILGVRLRDKAYTDL